MPRDIPPYQLPPVSYWYGPMGRRSKLWCLMAFMWDFQHGDKR
jgi:hypothetical protein